jgi:uncharacterized membrane protein YkvA (DUF1232 family)
MKKDRILNTFRKSVGSIDNNRLNEVLKKENNIKKKISGLNIPFLFGFFKKIKLSFQLLKDYKLKNYRDISWRSITVLVAGILYFLSPFDAIPDLLGVLGFTDDAVVLAFVFNSIRDELDRYIIWKGLNTEDYGL